MAATSNSAEYEEIDEAEEEALLKSDDESDVKASANMTKNTSRSEAFPEEDSLMNEASRLLDAPDTDDDLSNEVEDEAMKSVNITAGADTGNEDSDSEDDSELDESEKAVIEFKKTLKELDANQYAYDKYVQLCKLAHATDDLDNIRRAYNRFSSVYPLSPELWLQYLSIEMNVALSPKEIEHVEHLFRKALADYYSIEIALEFAALAPRCSDPESIWRELLGTYGLHCLNGQQFFKLYRKFIDGHKSLSEPEKQEAFIQSYLQELKYPLYNMEESYIEFKVFYEKNKAQISHNISWEIFDKCYFKAKEHQKKMFPFEQQLKDLDQKLYQERADVYINFIKESDKFLDENVLQTIYERMVADCCLNVDCWITYIDFIAYRDAYGRPEELQDLPVFNQTAVDVTKRALRNCSWSDKLYVRHIHLLEQQSKSREEVQEVLENSMTAGFQTAEPAVNIWTEYLTYLRRHTDWENEEECDVLRKNFNLAWTILGQQWGVLADCNCEILQFWGRLEYGPLKDAKRGKELWTTVMESADNATRSGLWIEFALLEMLRDLESTRKVYRKALHSPGLDNPLVIVSAWQRFERCNGTLKTLNNCTKECSEFLAQLSQVTRENSRETKGKTGKRKSTLPNETGKEKKAKQETSENVESTKMKEEKEINIAGPSKKAHEPTFKEHENQEIDLTKDHLRIFLSNLDYNLTEDDVIKSLPELKIKHVNLIRSANGRSRGFGYAELENASEVEKALRLDRRTLSGRPLYISSVLRDKEQRQKFKYSAGLEPRKLFVKSLPQDTSKEELEKIFSSFGKVQDVRLVYHKSGKFKNIAYVEFEQESSAARAVLGTNDLNLRGHTISVNISAPPPKPSAPLLNTEKLLGVSKKRNKVFDQKPRMSFIPTAVRKNFVATANSHSSNGSITKEAVKSNADFRKLLEK